MRDDNRPDIDAVLDPESPPARELPRGPDPREKKISKHIRMRIRYSEALRDEAYRETVRQGTKVSEADLVDEALTDWMAKRGLQ